MLDPTQKHDGDRDQDERRNKYPGHQHPARQTRGRFHMLTGWQPLRGLAGWTCHLVASLPSGASGPSHFIRQDVLLRVKMYRTSVPRLWNQTIEAHRHDVREAILDATWKLVTQRGLLAVTMSQVAAETGIGRATLYKYYRNVESILVAWHQRHVTEHLKHLTVLGTQPGDPAGRLETVLQAYARICHFRGRHGSEELGALLHRDEQVADARRQLLALVRGLLDDVAESGDLRNDVAPEELANFCVHALAAAGGLPSDDAVRRLVAVTMAAMQPPH